MRQLVMLGMVGDHGQAEAFRLHKQLQMAAEIAAHKITSTAPPQQSNAWGPGQTESSHTRYKSLTPQLSI